jgi:hypothetical protein
MDCEAMNQEGYREMVYIFFGIILTFVLVFYNFLTVYWRDCTICTSHVSIKGLHMCKVHMCVCFKMHCMQNAEGSHPFFIDILGIRVFVYISLYIQQMHHVNLY